MLSLTKEQFVNGIAYVIDEGEFHALVQEPDDNWLDLNTGEVYYKDEITII